MEGDGTPNGTNGNHVPLTLEALGQMIRDTESRVVAQLGSIQSDQVEAGKTLEEVARSHRRMRKRVMKFLNSMAAVYQRQHGIEQRLSEIDAWQKLHDKDHRDSKPPPSRRKRPKSVQTRQTGARRA